MRDDPNWDDFEDEPRVSFSGIETAHLAASIAVLSAAFAFALARPTPFIGDIPWKRAWTILPYSAIIVVTSFMLHEFAHKVAAQMRNMWAEFRASGRGLLFALVASVIFGVVLAAPGAVMIYGHATKRDSGVISLVGPWVNIALGLIALPFAFARDPILPIYRDGPDLFQVIVFVNAFLAAFNMIPVSPLDGSKVWAWSKVAYLLTAAAIIALFALFFVFTEVASSALPCVGQAC